MHYLPIEWKHLPQPLRCPRSITVEEVEGTQELKHGEHCGKPRLLDMTRLLYPQTQSNCGYVQRTCLRLIPAFHPQ